MKVHHLFLISALCVATGFDVIAQQPEKSPIIESITLKGNVTVIQPGALDERLKPDEKAAGSFSSGRAASESGDVVATRGYRVQLFSELNNASSKQEVNNRKRVFNEKFPGCPAYVSCPNLHWKLQVGDFTSRAEAEAFAKEVRSKLPAYNDYLKVVPCEINVRRK